MLPRGSPQSGYSKPSVGPGIYYGAMLSFWGSLAAYKSPAVGLRFGSCSLFGRRCVELQVFAHLSERLSVVVPCSNFRVRVYTIIGLKKHINIGFHKGLTFWFQDPV